MGLRLIGFIWRDKLIVMFSRILVKGAELSHRMAYYLRNRTECNQTESGNLALFKAEKKEGFE
jgi:hypothetical protein